MKRFKSYQSYLEDVELVLQESYACKHYEEIFSFSYRYCQLVVDALKGISHTFRYAEHGDYELALDRLRVIRDEYDLFRALLIILWYALDNENYQEANIIIEELERIPDDRVAYVAHGLDPFIVFILQKLKTVGIYSIRGIIGKHGLLGREAVLYLVELHQQVEFNKDLMRVFLGQLILTLDQLFASKEKAEAISIIVPIMAKTGSF